MTENYVLPVSSCPVNASTPSKVYESTSTMLPTRPLDPLSDPRRLRLARFDACSSRPDRTPRKIHLMTTRCNDPGTSTARKARMTLLMNGRTAVSLVLIKPRRSVVLCLGYPGRQTDLKKRNSYQSRLQNVSGHATIITMYFYSLFSSIGFSFLLCITPLSLSKFKYHSRLQRIYHKVLFIALLTCIILLTLAYIWAFALYIRMGISCVNKLEREPSYMRYTALF